VNYEVEGFGAFQTGPYGADEIEAQCRGIRSFAGIRHCTIVVQRDERRQLVKPIGPGQVLGAKCRSDLDF
jgi:hypothetical protein